MARHMDIAGPEGNSNIPLSAEEETARDAEEAAAANVFVLRDGPGGTILANGAKLSAAANNIDTIVVEVEKRDRAGSGVAADAEDISCCVSGLKIDSISKPLAGDPGVASFTFGPMDGIRGEWQATFCHPGLGSKLLWIEWT